MEYKVSYEVRNVHTPPDIPIDEHTRAYVIAFMRLEIDAWSVQLLAGGTIEQAREVARARLSDKDRMILAQEAERIAPLCLPDPQEP